MTLGIDDVKGSIKIGKDADIVIIDDACNVETTIKMENIMLSNDLSLVEQKLFCLQYSIGICLTYNKRFMIE